jgi:NAD(P)H dehydrogenase (quinone)
MSSSFILVAFYSVHGGTQLLAEALAKGIESVGMEARLRQIPPVTSNLDEQVKTVPDTGAPFVQLTDLEGCAGLALGSPTRFGNMSAAVKYFIDQTLPQWLAGSLIDKPASVFTSTGSMHGGQESTLLSMQIPLLHHGMLICGLPYSEAELHSTQSGGTPYGPSHLAVNKTPTLSNEEKTLAFAQGKRLAIIAKKLEAL